MRHLLRYSASFFILLIVSMVQLFASEPTSPTFIVAGAVEKPGSWTAERLQKEFASDIKTVDYTLKETKHTAHCLPLALFLRAVQPALDPKHKNHLLSFAVVVRAADKYTIAFGAGEFLPDYGNGSIYIALDKDGAMLSDDDAPVQLIVLGDKKPSYWIYGIRRIEVDDMSRFVDEKEKVK